MDLAPASQPASLRCLLAASRPGASPAVHPARDMFATASEDATIGVWRLPEGGAGSGARLKHVAQLPVPDCTLTGIAFCGGAPLFWPDVAAKRLVLCDHSERAHASLPLAHAPRWLPDHPGARSVRPSTHRPLLADARM